MSEQYQSVDWSDPTAVEALLASEGLGDIESEISPSSDLAIIEYYAHQTGSELAMPTIRSAIDRYANDFVGAAIAIHVTGMLAAEMPRDGALEATEEDIIDDVTSAIQKHTLVGITVEELARVGNINPEMGGLQALLDIRDMLDSCSESLVTELRERAGTLIQLQTEEEESEDLYIREELSADMNVDEGYEEAEDDEEDEGEVLVDESGEKFEI